MHWRKGRAGARWYSTASAKLAYMHGASRVGIVHGAQNSSTEPG